jgi:hypothetical protein
MGTPSSVPPAATLSVGTDGPDRPATRGRPPPGAPDPPDASVRTVVLEAVRQLHDPIQLERLTPLVRLRAVQARAARHYGDGWCAGGRALRDVLRAAVEPVAEVLPPHAAEMLRVLAAGGTAADAARRCGVAPAALRKRATPQIEEALARYLEHLEASGPP